MVCITREALNSRDFKDFRVVSGMLSKEEVCTLVETFEEFLKTNTSSDIDDIYKNREGYFLFLLSRNSNMSFDFYKYLNEHVKQDKGNKIDCINIRLLFPVSMSKGTFSLEKEYIEDSTSNIEEEATGYISEDELEYRQKDKVFILKYVSTGESIEISSKRYSIGRSRRDADFVVEGNTNVSRVHCYVYEEHGKVYVEDNNSLNGTFVNNRRLRKNGVEEAQIGDTIYVADEKFVLE